MREEVLEVGIVKQRSERIAQLEIAVAFGKIGLVYLNGLVWDDVEQGSIERHLAPLRQTAEPPE